MHVKQFIEFISSSNHYTLETWPTGITVTWTVTWYLLAKYNHCHIVGTQTPYLSRPPAPTRSMLFTNRKSALARSSDKLCFPTLNGGKGVCVCQRLMTLIAIIAILLAHQTPYLSRSPAPTRSMLFTNRKKRPRKEFGQIVLSNIEWGKGGVCVPTTYDTDCLYVIIWVTKLCTRVNHERTWFLAGKRVLLQDNTLFWTGAFYVVYKKILSNHFFWIGRLCRAFLEPNKVISKWFSENSSELM